MTETVSQTDSFLFALYLVYSVSFKPLPSHPLLPPSLSIYCFFFLFHFAFIIVFFCSMVFKSNQDLLGKKELLIDIMAPYSSLLLATVEGLQKAFFFAWCWSKTSNGAFEGNALTRKSPIEYFLFGQKLLGLLVGLSGKRAKNWTIYKTHFLCRAKLAIYLSKTSNTFLTIGPNKGELLIGHW